MMFSRLANCVPPVRKVVHCTHESAHSRLMDEPALMGGLVVAFSGQGPKPFRLVRRGRFSGYAGFEVVRPKRSYFNVREAVLAARRLGEGV